MFVEGQGYLLMFALCEMNYWIFCFVCYFPVYEWPFLSFTIFPTSWNKSTKWVRKKSPERGFTVCLIWIFLTSNVTVLFCSLEILEVPWLTWWVTVLLKCWSSKSNVTAIVTAALCYVLPDKRTAVTVVYITWKSLHVFIGQPNIVLSVGKMCDQSDTWCLRVCVCVCVCVW